MRLLRFLLLSLLPVTAFCATLTGDVTEMNSKAAMEDVFIRNIRTGDSVITTANGKFSINGNADDLIEFKKLGFKTVRIRVPKGIIPPYYKIIMQEGAIELPEYELAAKDKDWKKDSARFYDLYKKELEFEKLAGLDVIRHPFSALSKKNRQIWAFQKEYDYFQREKFIDYAFNDKIITAITGLQGDSLQFFMRRFRPTYEQVATMSDYTFYSYIKQNAIWYRTGVIPNYRPNIQRLPD